MQAYHNDTAIKRKYVARVQAHREADRLVQGTGWNSEEQRGCGIGCTLEAYDHERYETELGIPEWVARLEDTIFEGLPKHEAMLWPEQFLSVFPPGFNHWDQLKWRFCAYLMRGNIERVATLELKAELKAQILDAIRGVLAVFEGAIESGEWDESAAAWSAESARSAARSAASSAWSAARSAAWSAESAWSAEWSAYQRYRDEFLRLVVELSGETQ